MALQGNAYGIHVERESWVPVCAIITELTF